MHIISPARRAFTLVEVIVSTAIIGLIMIVLVSMTNQMGKTWRSSTEKIEKFQGARDGFEAMTRRMAQATLNTYWDYLDVNGNPEPTAINTTNYNNFVPVTYGRRSGLAFTSGPMTYSQGTPLASQSTNNPVRPTHGVFFTAPLGICDISQQSPYSTYFPAASDRNLMNNALNIWGYYVEANWDKTTPGFIAHLQTSTGQPMVPYRWRSRLMELRVPTEGMNLYDPTNTIPSTAWFTTPLASAYSNSQTANQSAQTSGGDSTVRVLAENVIALVLMPKLSKNDEENLSSGAGSPTGTPLPWQLCPWYIYDSTMSLSLPPGSPSIIANPGVTTTTNTNYVNPKNQLPPVIEVTMVAIDERSAKKLVDKYGGVSVNNGSTNGDALFWLETAGQKCVPPISFTSLFTNQAADPVGTSANGTPLEGPVGAIGTVADSDLNSLEQILIHEGLTYRVFTSNVTVRGAKWSRVQTK